MLSGSEVISDGKNCTHGVADDCPPEGCSGSDALASWSGEGEAGNQDVGLAAQTWKVLKLEL